MKSFRFVKRSLPIDDEHPRERFEHTRLLMIVADTADQRFLAEVREYFSSYGEIYACKYSHERNFSYIQIEFHDKGKSKLLEKTNDSFSF